MIDKIDAKKMEQAMKYLDSLNLSDSDKEQVLKLLIQDIESDGAITEQIEDDLYEHKPVSYEQFIEDDYYFGHIGKTLFPELKKNFVEFFTNENFITLVLTGAIGTGKCLTKGNKIFNCDTSEYITIGEAHGMNPFNTISFIHGEMEYTKNEYQHIVYSGVKDCVRLRFNSGRELTPSYDHRVFVFDAKNGMFRYVEAQDITTSMYSVVCPHYFLNDDSKKKIVNKLYNYTINNLFYVNFDTKTLSIRCDNKDIATDTQLLFNTIGIMPTIKKNKSWKLVLNGSSFLRFISLIRNILDNDDCEKADRFKYFLYYNKDKKVVDIALKLQAERKIDTILFDKVVSNKYIGKCEVYDLQVLPHENFVCNGIVVHNSWCAALCICRMVYETLCYNNPQRRYGIDPASKMVFINLSINATQAKGVLFGYVREMIKNSPWFEEHYPIDTRTKNKILFEKKNIEIYPGNSSETSMLGGNVFGATIDEINFIEDTKTTKRSKFDEEFNKARTLYTALATRIKSRYFKNKACKIIISSSKQFPEDFTEELIRKKNDGDNTIMICDYNQWDARKGLPIYDDIVAGGFFKVIIGNTKMASKIVTNEEDIAIAEAHGAKVIEVPEYYRNDFEMKLDDSIRDIAGEATLTVSPFITNREKIHACIDYSRKHPYTVNVTDLQGGSFFNEFFENIPDKGAPRVVHIDLSKNTCATGLAMGYVKKYVDIVNTQLEGNEEVSIVERVPFIHMDLMMKIMPPLHGEIQYSDIRRLIYMLKSRGFNIKYLSTDQFQDGTMQDLKKLGVIIKQTSMDRTIAPYNDLKNAIYENRISFYEYEPFYDELIWLLHDKKKNKVNKTHGHSKDVTDAVAGVAHICTTIEFREPALMPSSGKINKELKNICCHNCPLFAQCISIGMTGKCCDMCPSYKMCMERVK